MQEQYDRKKVELEQKLLREKAELAKVDDYSFFWKRKGLFNYCYSASPFCNEAISSTLNCRNTYTSLLVPGIQARAKNNFQTSAFNIDGSVLS